MLIEKAEKGSAYIGYVSRPKILTIFGRCWAPKVFHGTTELFIVLHEIKYWMQLKIYSIVTCSILFDTDYVGTFVYHQKGALSRSLQHERHPKSLRLSHLMIDSCISYRDIGLNSDQLLKQKDTFTGVGRNKLECVFQQNLSDQN